jgi:hypothetical protein
MTYIQIYSTFVILLQVAIDFNLITLVIININDFINLQI